MSELKPCPFCGGEAKVQKDVRFPKNVSNGVTSFEVICENPECPIYTADTRYYRFESQAITAWNTRAETEAERKIEKVREKLESLKNDARMMNEAESIALDYVTDFLLEILEDDNENQRKSD